MTVRKEETLEALWKEYLSHKPTDDDLRSIIIQETIVFPKEKAFKELKKRKALKKEDALDTILFTRDAEDLKQEAWQSLYEMGPENSHLERIIKFLDNSDPIKKKAREILGRGKAEILSEIRQVIG